MFEFLLELLGEFLIQLVLEVFAEIGFHWLAEPFRRRPNPWVAAAAYALFGAVAGGLSLLAFPVHLLRQPAAQILNLIVTPFAVGLAMWTMGQWRASRGEIVFRLDRFWYGYLFALALAVIRFWFAR